MNFLDNIKAEFEKIKSGITHFLTTTRAGQEIEKIGYDILALPGFHDFLARAKPFALKTAVSFIQAAAGTPGSKSLNDVFDDTKAAVAAEYTNDLHAVGAGWEHTLTGLVLQEASTIPGVKDLLAALAPSLGPTQTPLVEQAPKQ
jgi:hypothetical protein